MDGWVDRGRRHQIPSLIAKSKGAARGGMEMFDHRLKVYRNIETLIPVLFSLCPSSFYLVALVGVLYGSADPRMVPTCRPRHSNHISIRSIGRSTRPRTETSIAVKQIANRRIDTFR